jgi:hypothetical protein
MSPSVDHMFGGDDGCGDRPETPHSSAALHSSSGSNLAHDDRGARRERCGAQKLVMQQRGKCGVTRQAQVPRRSFGMLAEGGALPRRVELPGPKSGAVASDCNR